MAIDPTPFLSTMAGSSAGLVAIIGGLLVSRFIGLDSEQQGAERLLSDTEAKLSIARDKAHEAAERLVAFEAEDYLGQREVLKLLMNGAKELVIIRQFGGRTHLTDDQLRPRVEQLRQEFDYARLILEAKVPQNPDRDPDYENWDILQPKLLLPHAAVRHDRVWAMILREIVDGRYEELQRLKEERLAEFRQTSQLARMIPDLTAFDTSNLGLGATPDRAAQAIYATQLQDETNRKHDALSTAVSRAEQRVEDLEAEVERHRQHRAVIIKPNRQLWIGLFVLTYPTVVGVVLPLLAMSDAPKDFTPYIHNLVWLFFTGLAALIGYLYYLVIRLTRAKASTTASPP
ncbi:MAG TPA: hypothetical protein VHX38_28815 [Pseudonocardiaceae bacterium]|jgi:hypothetical protein|nr:hypothetical protein [Pseudonocardiaceae bacterium]